MNRLFLAAALAATLSACAFYVTPQPSTSVRVRPIPSPSKPDVVVTNVSEISTFAPTRGEGSVYNLGESISFEVRTSGSGYLTLTAYGPDGTASVLSQGMYVPGGTSFLPTAESGVSYDLAPPRGLHRVTASFSSDASGSVTQDTAETTFYIQ